MHGVADSFPARAGRSAACSAAGRLGQAPPRERRELAEPATRSAKYRYEQRSKSAIALYDSWRTSCSGGAWGSPSGDRIIPTGAGQRQLAEQLELTSLGTFGLLADGFDARKRSEAVDAEEEPSLAAIDLDRLAARLAYGLPRSEPLDTQPIGVRDRSSLEVDGPGRSAGRSRASSRVVQRSRSSRSCARSASRTSRSRRPAGGRPGSDGSSGTRSGRPKRDDLVAPALARPCRDPHRRRPTLNSRPFAPWIVSRRTASAALLLGERLELLRPQSLLVLDEADEGGGIGSRGPPRIRAKAAGARQSEPTGKVPAREDRESCRAPRGSARSSFSPARDAHGRAARTAG